MKNIIKLTDIVEIAPNKQLVNLSKLDKHRLMDSVLQNPAEGRKRGLYVSFNLSSSGRRINNRIYTPRGQQAGQDSWTAPYPKPIIRNHDTNEDPLGRFEKVTWKSLEDEALKHFKSVNEFMKLKNAFDMDDPRAIYRIMKRNHLLTDKSWKGLGELVATARIVDEDAIEKFLDGRYLTFSAGSNTDAYRCGICGDDWAQGDVCEHRPGQITEDGEMGVFITGAFNGDEASVLTSPANDASQVLSMEFVDSADTYKHVGLDCRYTDDSTIYLMDVNLMSKKEIPTTQEDTQEESKVVIEDSNEQADVLIQQDTEVLTDTETVEEAEEEEVTTTKDEEQSPDATALMVDMLGILVSQYLLYYQAHWKSQGEPFYADHLLFERLYDGVKCELDSLAEKIIGYNGTDAIDIVELSKLITSNLTEWTSASNLIQQGLASESIMQSRFKENHAKLKEMGDLPMGLDDYLMATASSHDTHQYLLQQRTSSDGVEIDWNLLGLALEGEVSRLVASDATLKESHLDVEALSALADSAFCGPDKTFPVPNKVYADAAKALVAKAKLSDAAKAAILFEVELKEKLFKDTVVESTETIQATDSSDTVLEADYAEALKTIENLKKELKDLQIATTDGNNDNTDSQDTTDVESEDVKTVENPSVNSSDPSARDTAAINPEKFSGYEKRTVMRYNDILEKAGLENAEAFIAMQKRKGYLALNFDPNTLMES